MNTSFLKRLSAAVIDKPLSLMPDSIVDSIVNTNPKIAKLIRHNRDINININSDFFSNQRLLLNTEFAVDRSIIYDGYYDLKSLLYFKRILKHGNVCIDIGANIGGMAIPIANMVTTSGKVFSFEPGPALFKRLEKNITQNNLSQVELFQLGLSDKKGKLYWQFDKCQPGNAVLSDNGNIEVDVTRLDDVTVLFNQKIDLIKIDVEGMELEVLTGGSQLIQKDLPVILFESQVSDEIQYNKLAAINTMLLNLGYGFYEIDKPYRSLNVNSTFNFVPTHFPRLPQNTLAVHDTQKHLIGLN